MAIVKCQKVIPLFTGESACGEEFDMNEVKGNLQNDYVPMCRLHDSHKHMSAEELTAWYNEYVNNCFSDAAYDYGHR